MKSQKNILLLQSNLTCVFAATSFAMGFPALDILLSDWGIVSIVLVRNTVAFILISLIWLISEDFDNLVKAKWLKGFLIGAIGFGLGSLLLGITQLLTTTVIAALAAALMPIAAITLEIIFDKRRISISFLIGLSLVLIGSAVILGINRIDLKFSFGLFLGVMSVTFFAWGSRASVRHLPKMTTLARTATTTLGMCGFSLIVYLICLYFKFKASEIPNINSEHVKLIAIYACFGLAISQLLWIQGVQNLGIGIASLHLNIVPFYVMIILFIIGHKWIWIQAIGALIIIIGISVTQINFKNFIIIGFKNR